jgi:hypothetical protein
MNALNLLEMVGIMLSPFTLASVLSLITRNPGERNGFGNYDWTDVGDSRNWTDVGDSRDRHRAAHDLEAARSRFS